MALPVKKHSKSRSKKRRGGKGLEKVMTVKCSNCETPKQPHVACANCGDYKGKSVIKKDVEIKKSK